MTEKHAHTALKCFVYIHLCHIVTERIGTAGFALPVFYVHIFISGMIWRKQAAKGEARYTGKYVYACISTLDVIYFMIL